MTRRERERLREAVRLLGEADTGGGEYDAGMTILCRLLGVPDAHFNRLNDLSSVSTKELFAGPQGDFGRSVPEGDAP